MIYNLKGFKNYYCDATYCSLGEFFSDEEIAKIIDKNYLTKEDTYLCAMISAMKNKIAGVSEVNLKVLECGAGLNALDKFGLKGREVLSSDKIDSLPTSALIGEKTMIEVEDLSAQNDDNLSYISDFIYRSKMAVIINFVNLEGVGRTVNKFGCSPAELIEDFGFLDRECYCLGLNFVTKEDLNCLRDYEILSILTLTADARRGEGAMNVYTYEQNRYQFGFGSGKHYIVDILAEARKADEEASNIILRPDVLRLKTLLDAVQSDNGEVKIEIDDEAKKDTILDKHIALDYFDENLHQELLKLVKKLKEKI